VASANSFDLTGRVALVTGGNGGIGRSIALAFARAGASVAILGRNEKKNQTALADLKTLGGPTMAIRVDIAKRAELEPAFQQVEKTLGPVGILVNNAGTVAFNPALQQSPEEWDQVIETNLTAAFLLSKIAGRSKVERRAGKIINIASMYSFFGSSIVPSYSVSKGGLVQLTKSMAIELAPHNIQVNAIAPGWFVTELTEPVKNTPLYQEVIDRTPGGRWGHPDEVAGAAVFLAGPASDFVTGTTLVVDGGYAIR
jgi:2-deoxy-D-gluconate 3-dehydrogenase